MRALVTDVCISEFGWELMEWQGYVRKKAELCDKVVVCSSVGNFVLYRDLSPIYIGHSIRGNRDCHAIRRGTLVNPEELKRVQHALAQAEDDLRQQQYHITKISPTDKGRLTRRSIGQQKFIPFGDASKVRKPYKLIIHARNRLTSCYSTGANYPIDRWNDLIRRLRSEGIDSIGAVGTKDAAMLPERVDDLRGIALSDVMDHMAAANFVMGPSSGPMHLASLCQTPHVVWATSRKQEVLGGEGNAIRYQKLWNPFGTPVAVLLHKKNEILSPRAILELTMKFIGELVE